MRLSRLGLLGLFSVLVFTSSCAPPEQVLVDSFLAAVRDGQEEMSAAMSLVSFPEEEDFDSWEIVEIGPESTVAYKLADLRDAAVQAKEAHEAKIEQDDDFLRSNEEIAIRYQQKMREDPEYRYPSGRMAEFQAAWEARLEEQKDLHRQAEEASDAVETERNAIRMSAKMGLKNSFDGDVSEKNVTVRLMGGGEPKTYTLTLRRYNLTDTESGLSTTPSWIVTDIQA